MKRLQSHLSKILIACNLALLAAVGGYAAQAVHAQQTSINPVLTTDASNFLKVNCATGCGGVSAGTDNVNVIQVGSNTVAQVGASGIQQVSTYLNGSGTTGTTSVSSASATLVPATALTGRQRLTIQNLDPSIVTYCSVGTPVATNSLKLLSNGVWDFPVGATNVVRCIGASGTPTVAYQELS